MRETMIEERAKQTTAERRCRAYLRFLVDALGGEDAVEDAAGMERGTCKRLMEADWESWGSRDLGRIAMVTRISSDWLLAD